MSDVTLQLPSVEILVVGGMSGLALLLSFLAFLRSRIRDRVVPIEFRELIAGVLLFFATVMFMGAVGTSYAILLGYLGPNPYLWWVPVGNLLFGLVFVAISALSKYAS